MLSLACCWMFFASEAQHTRHFGRKQQSATPVTPELGTPNNIHLDLSPSPAEDIQADKENADNTVNYDSPDGTSNHVLPEGDDGTNNGTHIVIKDDVLKSMIVKGQGGEKGRSNSAQARLGAGNLKHANKQETGPESNNRSHASMNPNRQTSDKPKSASSVRSVAYSARSSNTARSLSASQRSRRGERSMLGSRPGSRTVGLGFRYGFEEHLDSLLDFLIPNVSLTDFSHLTHRFRTVIIISE